MKIDTLDIGSIREQPRREKKKKRKREKRSIQFK